MRVMVIGPIGPDDFADNVANSLRTLGHEVLAAGPARRNPPHRRASNAVSILSDRLPVADEWQQRHLIVAAAHFRPDLVINLQVILRPATVAKLQRHARFVVLWFPDAVSNLGRHDALIAGYDRLYLKNEPLVRQLAHITGLPAVYLPEAANPVWHRPIGPYGIERTIVVAGNLHPSRALLLDHLLADGIPLSIYGPPMPAWLDFPSVRAAHTGQYLVREEKARAFRSARAVLNNLHPGEFAGSNCRLFEAASCGAVTLTEHREGMDELFVTDKEVLTFASYSELLARCRELLASPNPGRQIADAAATRAARDHTYAHRLARMFDDLGV